MLTVLTILMYSLVVGVIARAVTHEELFRELREFAESDKLNRFGKKLFYPFTCNYCFSFYVTGVVLLLTKFNIFDQEDGNKPLTFLLTLLTVMGVSVGLQAWYTYTTLKIEERRGIIEHRRLIITAQKKQAWIDSFNLRQLQKQAKLAEDYELQLASNKEVAGLTAAASKLN